MANDNFRLAIVGGGPSALFIIRELAKLPLSSLQLTLFEKSSRPGAGMPYSDKGAGIEHIANISAGELPELVIPFQQWMENVSPVYLQSFGIDKNNSDAQRVLPRLLLGDYLADQFARYREKLGTQISGVEVKLNTTVTDIRYDRARPSFIVVTEDKTTQVFDAVIVCTGHVWPQPHEGKTPGYFDSPYPPAKLMQPFNCPVALRGSSLTAVDAMRTMARVHGNFSTVGGKIKYHLHSQYASFRMVMHSFDGLLPAVRLYSGENKLDDAETIPEGWIEKERGLHDGFLPLDLVFNKRFREPISKKDPVLFAKIKDMELEEFVEWVMSFRKEQKPFALLQQEYDESLRSIRRHEIIPWKELLTDLSFAMNYPAKYFSAEDRQRLQKTLMPLISTIIAFLPQDSAQELLALHEANCLEIISIDKTSSVTAREEGGITYHYGENDNDKNDRVFDIYIDCTGQQAISFDEFPFHSLRENGIVSPAFLRFENPSEGRRQLKKQGSEKISRDDDGYYLQVPGVAINDVFRAVDRNGNAHSLLYIMAVPLIAGFNPDYSGLDFCAEASERIVKDLIQTIS